MAETNVKRIPQTEISVGGATFSGGEGEADALQAGIEVYPWTSRALPSSESNDRWEGSIGFGVAWRKFSGDAGAVLQRSSDLDETTAGSIIATGGNPVRVRDQLADQRVTTPPAELDYLNGSETHPYEVDQAVFLEGIIRGQWNWGRFQTPFGRVVLHTGLTPRVGLAAYHQPETTGSAAVQFENEAPEQLCEGASNHPRCQNSSGTASHLDPIRINHLETTQDAALSLGLHAAVDLNPVGLTVGRWTINPWVRVLEAYAPIVGEREGQIAAFNGGGINLSYLFGGDKKNEGRRKVGIVSK